MGSILNDIALGEMVERLLKIWWMQILIYGFASAVLISFLYKDIRYWIAEYKKNKNNRNKTKKRKWVVTSWTKEESNPILYFFFVLLGFAFTLSFILMVKERFFPN